jgi:hypothetical protein
MGNNLQFYNAAKAAIAKAVKVDEVKNIHGKAAALKAAAKVANDKSLEADAVEIRMRAERRLGELMKDQKKTVGANKGGRPSKKKTGSAENPVSEKPGTLAEAGIGKRLANEARTEAKKTEEEFERDVAAEKAKIANPAPKLKLVNGNGKVKKVLGLIDQTVETVRDTVEGTVRQMRRDASTPKEKYERLFAALKDVLEDAESAAMAPFDTVEESADRRRTLNAALADQA